MTIRNLGFLMQPRSIAVIGASAEAGSVGYWLARNVAASFKGDLAFVNPRTPVIEGRRAVASVAALAQAPDLAVIATPPQTVPGLLAELGSRGTRAAVVVTAGIRAELRQQMLDAAKPYCLRILGPNIIGLMVPKAGVNASFSHIAAPAGDLAFLSQSGALITGIVDWAAAHDIGFSHVVSLGDMADIDFGDMLDYLAGDTASAAILLYMESLTNAAKFMSAARRAARAKPVIVIKSGRHAAGAKAAASHTGALSGADSAYDAAFRRAGLLRVNELKELFNAAEVLAHMPRLYGERLTILTNGGGAGVLAADRMADLGGKLAELSPETIAALDAVLPATWSHGNPVDIIGDAGPERYARALEAIITAPETDAVLTINCPTAVVSSTAAAEAVIKVAGQSIRGGRLARPVFTNWLGNGAAEAARTKFAKAGIASFETPGEAVEGFMYLARHARAQEELMRTPPSRTTGLACDRVTADKIIAEAAAAGRAMLSETEAKALLAAYDIPVVPTRAVASVDEAGTAARDLLWDNRAVVLKIRSDDISHKSDAGGVVLDLKAPDEVRHAASAMLARIKTRLPEARIDGFTVQPMIDRKRAHELIIGMSEDRTFGPTLMFGAGGTAVEVMRDTSLALPPLDTQLARDLIARTRISRLLAGYRDRPAARVDDIAATLVKVSQLVADFPAIRELDINPLLADEAGVVALDARVRISAAGEAPRRPMSLKPYPVQWERKDTVKSLGEILIRPIRPEDEHLYQRFFEKLTPEDLRLRFFTTIKGLDHRLLARLTQIDYAREIAFVALDCQGELLGVARFNADPDYTHAEYGVIVRSDLKGAGLGWRLMHHLIAYAKAEGLSKLTGMVLSENVTMLAMCRELGFDITSVPEDPTVREVVLDLAKVPPQT